MRSKTNRLLMLLISASLAGCASQTERSSSGAGADQAQVPVPAPSPPPKSQPPAPANQPEQESVQFIDRPLEPTPAPKPAPAQTAKQEPLPDFPITKYEMPADEEVGDLGEQPDESGTMSAEDESLPEQEDLVSEPQEFAEEEEAHEVADLGQQPDESGTMSADEESRPEQQDLVSEPQEFAEEPQAAAQEEPHEVADLGQQPDESGTVSYPAEDRPTPEGLVSQPKVYAEEGVTTGGQKDAGPLTSEPKVYADETPTPKPAPKLVSVDFEAEPLFSFDKSIIRADQRSKLDDFVSSLQGTEYSIISVVGHTDRIGTDAYNQKLSERRANAVKAYLVRQGVPAEMIQTEGRGESEPVTGDTCKGQHRGKALISCLQPDRRVDISVTGTKRTN